jgi:hypothetical protein
MLNAKFSNISDLSWRGLFYQIYIYSSQGIMGKDIIFCKSEK